MIFVELLVVEVHHLEIVIGRLPAAARRLPGATLEPGGFARYVGNDIKESIASLYITDFRDCR